MNIICDKTLLSNAIDGVSKAVTLRSAIPALEGILLKAEGFQLTLTGYDLEVSITTTIEANVRQAGEIVLSAKLLGDMVRRLPSGEVSIYTNESGNATIKGGVAEFDILAMSASDYPDLPSHGADHTFTIKADVLRDMIEKTLYAVSQDDKKPAHTGELFSIEEDKLTVVALDGYRLAIVERPIQAEKNIRIIIPAKTLTEVNKLLGSEEDEVQIAANRRFVVFQSGNYTILSRLIEGEFLNYANVIPNGCKTRVLLESRDFIDTIERASLIITERLKNPLRILFESSGKVTVRCQTNLGKVVDEFSAQVEGDPVEIGFNNRYLLDALRNARCEKVVMELSGPLSPVKILPEEGEDFIYLVLPVRFKND